MKNIKTYLIFTSIGMAVFGSSLTYADSNEYFSNQDWEIICDNVGTCRAAGYQIDGDATPASILLTRKAGAKQPVLGEFTLSSYSLNQVNSAQIKLFINQSDLGRVKVDRADEELIVGQLNTAQVQAILKNAKQKQNIRFQSGAQQWSVSDAGLTAVLLKMDDKQQRVGTIGALIKKGSQSEQKVLPAKQIPIVQYQKISPKLVQRIQPKQVQYKALAQTLSQAIREPDDCNVISDDADWSMQARQPIDIHTLDQNRVLVSTLCWRGAYNEGYGYWIMNKSLKGKAQNITYSASEITDGKIYSSQKGRGVGDCWSVAEWAWNGKTFIQTKDYWTGMCRGLALGGAWELKSVDAIVRD